MLCLWIQRNNKYFRNYLNAPNMLAKDILFKVACNLMIVNKLCSLCLSLVV